ncbi:hypothetical protein BS333_21195 (plasmid) [Vibrio azureus]|uniref:Bacteriophage T5 Orf172 DNA-binding domain-containing protein n=1 Tax=Vibrio azureus NBRC 104587 TaxID=1219077 RepID=U3AWA3_9VIBR|nr:DUF4041 domain-containing protein [Vibrio azureus]AUI88893.1 hypothetical protein BS333_21195 [Vibrio azureus]GAD78040.1 hypothetical protein VAZ01S_114_00050 [Vibrio azureus NBRC 104587]
MFGFVKKSLLLDAQANITGLEKQLNEAKEELSSIQQVLASPEYMKATDLIQIEEELCVLRATCHDVRAQIEKDREAAKEHLSVIEKQCALIVQDNESVIERAKSELAEETLNAHKQKDLILSEANVDREKIISNAEVEAQAIVDNAKVRVEKVLEDIEKKIEAGETREKQLSCSIDKLREELRDLELTKEHHELLSTVTPFEQLIDGPTSDEIKVSLQQVKNKQKDLIKQGNAFEILQDILWNDNLAKGKARQKRHGKFLITAFNAEVDNIIANTNARNFTANAKKIDKWFQKVNKSGDDSYVELNRTLLFLRLEEQRHVFEYKYKKEMELEEQRFMKESLREEAKVKKEIESFVTAREKEEKAFQQDLSDALARVQTSNQEEVEKLNSYIEELKLKLERTSSEKERALSMAQLTRSGYVYIISNKGSFGEDVYKIGMTRRLEPMDRVKELGDASVPFFFDVHALIPSDDAPALESKLHSKFASRRVNKVNHRREFFNLTFEEVEEALNEFVEGDFNLVRDVAATQYEESKFLEERELVNG